MLIIRQAIKPIRRERPRIAIPITTSITTHPSTANGPWRSTRSPMCSEIFPTTILVSVLEIIFSDNKVQPLVLPSRCKAVKACFLTVEDTRLPMKQLPSSAYKAFLLVKKQIIRHERTLPYLDKEHILAV